MGEDTAQLVTPGRTRRSSSYTEPGQHLHSEAMPAHYRAGLGGGCCHLEDTAALRMIVVRIAGLLFGHCVTQLKLYTLYKLSSTLFCCLSVRHR